MSAQCYNDKSLVPGIFLGQKTRLCTPSWLFLKVTSSSHVCLNLQKQRKCTEQEWIIMN